MKTTNPAQVVVLMAAITFVAILAAAVLVPENYSLIVRDILAIAVPTTTALLAYLRSSSNAGELINLHSKTDELKQEAEEAKRAATTVNAIVADQIAPKVDIIERDVKIIKKNGHESKS